MIIKVFEFYHYDDKGWQRRERIEAENIENALTIWASRFKSAPHLVMEPIDKKEIEKKLDIIRGMRANG